VPRQTKSLRHMTVVRSAFGIESSPLHHSRKGRRMPQTQSLHGCRLQGMDLLREGILGEGTLSWMNSHGALALTGDF